MAEIKKIESLNEFNEFVNLNDGRLAVVKIGSSWCGPCRVLEGTLSNLTQEEVEGVMLGEVDVDDEWFEDKSAELKIRGIPVIIAYKDGAEVERLVGAATKDTLIEFFERNK
jgi:thioredoxin 1